MCRRTIINETELNNKFFLISVPIIFIICSISHFVFELSGKNILLAIIFPVNESIFQHLKLCFYSIVFFWIICYIILRNKYKILYGNWILSMICSALICMFLVLSLYYIFAAALSIESLYLDLAILLVSITISHRIAIILYNHNLFNYCYFSLDYILIFLLLAFTLFTFFPPQIPLFFDNVTKSYGF